MLYPVGEIRTTHRPSNLGSRVACSVTRTESVEIQFGFDLFPRHPRFAGIAFYRAAKFDKVFHVLETLLEPAHLSGERLQSRILQGGSGVTHKLPSDL